MTPKLLKRDIGVSETTLKRTKATRLDIAVLTEQLQDLKSETCRDTEASRTSLQALDEKLTAFDAAVDAVGRNIGQCQEVIVAVKETLDAQTGRLTMALRESEEQQHGRSAAADERMKAMDERMTATDERMTAMDERLSSMGERMNEMSGSVNQLGGRMNELSDALRSIDEKNTRQSEAMRSRVEALEEHLPKLETEMKALDVKADRIEQFQQKINARIVAVMRLSLAIIGVVVVTAIVFAFLLRR